MLNWLKRNHTKEYKHKLLRSFPAKLQSDVETVVNILPLNKMDIELNDGQIHKLDNLIHSDELNICLNGETLTIPYRLYFEEPTVELENRLTEDQKAILNCIFLRHHNGYLRERRLKQLISRSDYWIIPFTIQLLGEYVFEILETLDGHLNTKTLPNYISFTEENPKYWQKTESRMISYWNEYYRWKNPKLKEYLGYKMVKMINKTNAQHGV